VIARVALVLVLLVVAVQGLSGRRHLDWAAIADDPAPTWTALVLIAAAAFVVVVSMRALLRMLRVTQESDDEGPQSMDGSRVTWYGYLAAGAVIALAILLVYLLLKSTISESPKFRDQGQFLTNDVGGGSQGGNASIDPWLVLIAVLAGVGLAVVAFRRRGALDDEPFDDEVEEPSEDTALAEAVAAAEVELDSHGDDTRAAIIAAYLAMERQLVASGSTRQASDTPTDFLMRAMSTSRVSRGSATRLTELFREARFSTHPMAATARADAARALARVGDDLSAPHG
jgi:Na+-transporting methylmalonyl-CoA/oxaloacetate decarboxylase gamma subunit